ncbi:MAG: phosphoribosylformylglycinamidine synthase subunit PurS [Vagococcus sp.]
MYEARVYVSYKSSVLNPQAEVVEGAINKLGYKEVTHLKMGKFFDFSLSAKSKVEAEKKVEMICDRLLANVNMETYRYDVLEVE